MSFGTLEIHGHSNIFSLGRRVQQPIKNFTGPWDNFMVHGCKQCMSPLSLFTNSSCTFPNWVRNWHSKISSSKGQRVSSIHRSMRFSSLLFFLFSSKTKKCVKYVMKILLILGLTLTFDVLIAPKWLCRVTPLGIPAPEGNHLSIVNGATWKC